MRIAFPGEIFEFCVFHIRSKNLLLLIKLHYLRSHDSVRDKSVPVIHHNEFKSG